MRRKRAKQELMVLGLPPRTPTDDERAQVRCHAFNGLSEERISQIMNIPVQELRYLFSREMNYSTDEITAASAQRMIALAAQAEDLGVSLKANQLILQSRLKTWRVPSADAPDTSVKQIEKMTLDELDAEIAKLRAISPT